MSRNRLDDSRISEGTLANRHDNEHRASDGSHDSRAISRDDFRDGFAERPASRIEPHLQMTVAPEETSGMPMSKQADDAPRQRTHIYAAGKLVRDRVRNAAGENLGTIKEIAIDVVSGQVAYVVLSFGGVFGIGDKLFTVPWRAVRLDEAEDEFVIETTRETLERSPGVDRHDMRFLSDQWGGLAGGTADTLWPAPASTDQDGAAVAR